MKKEICCDDCLYKLLECAIEFAWQTKENNKISRAEQRHKLVDEVLEFANQEVPDEDIDEFISEYLKGRLID